MFGGLKKNTFISCLFLLLTLNAASQLISTRPAEISTGPLSFNAAVVKQNRIRSIVLDMVDKPDGSVIIDKDATQGFEFDTEGRVVRYYYTILNKTEAQEVDVPAVKRHGRIIRPATTKMVTKYINDTVFANVFYDQDSRIIDVLHDLAHPPATNEDAASEVKPRVRA